MVPRNISSKVGGAKTSPIRSMLLERDCFDHTIIPHL
jgi:hypothetical protein